MICWLSGPTGAGKTTMARALARHGFAVVREGLPAKKFDAFVSHPHEYCASTQESMMRYRLQRWKAVKTCKHVVFDRSISEDAEVFCRLHRKLGFLTQSQLTTLIEIANDISAQLPAPNLILYLAPNQRILRKRVTSTTHPDFIVKSLDLQVDLYARWLARRTADIIQIDNSLCSPQSIAKFFGLSI